MGTKSTHLHIELVNTVLSRRVSAACCFFFCNGPKIVYFDDDRDARYSGAEMLSNTTQCE